MKNAYRKQFKRYINILESRVGSNDPSMTSVDLTSSALSADYLKFENDFKLKNRDKLSFTNQLLYSFSSFDMSASIYSQWKTDAKKLQQQDIDVEEMIEEVAAKAPGVICPLLKANYYITDFAHASEELCLKIKDLCLTRNRKLSALNGLIKNPAAYLAEKPGDSLIDTAQFRDLLFQLATDISKLDTAEGGAFVEVLNNVLTGLQVVLENIGVDVENLPDSFYLKQYLRYLTGYAHALNSDNDKSQWTALYLLSEPFEDHDLQTKAEVILHGLLTFTLFDQEQNPVLRNAMDIRLLSIAVFAASPNDSKRIELEAYARLVAGDAVKLAKIPQLQHHHDQCMQEFMTILNEEANKAGENPTTLRNRCDHVIAKIAFNQLQLPPAPHPQAFFQPATIAAPEINEQTFSHHFSTE